MAWLYDGWGNRLTQNAVKGAVPTMVTITDPATNRIQSHTYDQNGNTTNTPQQGAMTYDVMNRLKTIASDTYGYDPSNKRIWKNDEYTFYGAGGERIGRYSATKLVNDTGTHVFVFQKVQVDEYFGGRRLTTQDRLGSVGSYYPYGESRSGTVSNADSFATYYRDSTGLDYADQRVFQAVNARFATTDPLPSSAEAANPASWNRYAYGLGDPVNHVDPYGLDSSVCSLTSGSFYCRYSYTTASGSVYTGWGQNSQLSEAQAFAEAGAYLGAGIGLSVNLLNTYQSCAEIFSTAEKRKTYVWNPQSTLVDLFAGPYNYYSGFNMFIWTDSSFTTALPKGTFAFTQPLIANLFGFTFGTINVQLNREEFLAKGRAGRIDMLAAVLLHELGHVYDALRIIGSGGSLILDDRYSEMNQARNQILIQQRCHVDVQ